MKKNSGGFTLRLLKTSLKGIRCVRGQSGNSSSTSQELNRCGDCSSSTPAENPTLMSDFPDEIIVEILSRLPVKDILRIRSVCKLWKTLISDPNFIKKHLFVSAADASLRSRYVIMSHGSDRIKCCSLYSLYNKQTTFATEPPCSVQGSIVGSCNGLICLVNEPGNILLWNPTIRKSNKLPRLHIKKQRRTVIAYGFGYDCSNDDYKVAVIIDRKDEDTVVMVYSSRSKCWRSIQGFRGHLRDEFGQFVNGTLYWTGITTTPMGSRQKIVSLDLATEKFSEMPMPKYENRGVLISLGVLGDCLGILYNYFLKWSDIWLLRESHGKKAWELLASISYSKDSRGEFLQIDNNPLWISNKGEILFKHSFEMVLYNSKCKTLRHPVIKNLASSRYDNEVIFMESLVSPTVI